MSQTFRLMCRQMRKSFNPVEDLKDLGIRYRILTTIDIKNQQDINYAINQLKITKDCSDNVIKGYLIYKKKPVIASEFMRLHRDIKLQEERIYTLIEQNSGMNGRMNKYE